MEFKKIDDMTSEEYTILKGIFECKENRTPVVIDDLEKIYNTFISKAKICRTCSSMLSSVFSRTIRFFEKSFIELSERFEIPEIEVKSGLFMNNEIFDRKCLNCSKGFNTKHKLKVYCSETCRVEFKVKRAEYKQRKMEEIKIPKLRY